MDNEQKQAPSGLPEEPLLVERGDDGNWKAPRPFKPGEYIEVPIASLEPQRGEGHEKTNDALDTTSAESPAQETEDEERYCPDTCSELVTGMTGGTCTAFPKNEPLHRPRSNERRFYRGNGCMFCALVAMEADRDAAKEVIDALMQRLAHALDLFTDIPSWKKLAAEEQMGIMLYCVRHDRGGRWNPNRLVELWKDGKIR